MTTLEMVAQKAGVSTSTASRVLNNVTVKIPISKSTCDRVREAASELGYVPSGAARALRQGRSNTLGVLGASVDFFRGIYSSGALVGEIMKGLLEASIEFGYDLTLLTGHKTQPGVSHRSIDVGFADGLLVVNRDLGQETPQTDQHLQTAKPIVYVLDYPDDAKVYFSAPNDVQGGQLAVESLIQTGHRRIGFIRLPQYRGIFDRRQKGWAEGLQKAGIQPHPHWIIDDPQPERVKHLLESEQITAAICANDPIGIRFKTSLESLGQAEQVAIIAFSHEYSRAPKPREITSLVHPLSEVVSSSVQKLVHLIEGKGKVERQTLFPYRLVDGKSFQRK